MHIILWFFVLQLLKRCVDSRVELSIQKSQAEDMSACIWAYHPTSSLGPFVILGPFRLRPNMAKGRGDEVAYHQNVLNLTKIKTPKT